MGEYKIYKEPIMKELYRILLYKEKYFREIY